MRNLKTASLLLILFCFTVSAQNFWEKTNGPFGGTVYTIKPLTGDSILAATDNGIYISPDLGANWGSYNVNLEFKSVNDVEKFQDGFVAILDNQALIKITPSSYDTIYSSSERPWTVAVSARGKIFLGTDYGLYASTDAGATWMDIEDPGMNIHYSSDIIFKNDTIIFYSQGNEIFRSYDDGQNWTLINYSFQQGRVNSIYLDDEGNLYAGAGFAELYKSTDNGDSWETLNSDNEFTTLCKDSSYFYGGTNQGIFRSTDGGYTWYGFSNGLFHNSLTSIINYRGIFACTYGGGAYLLNGNNNQWEFRSDGIDAAWINDLIVDSDDNVFAGTYGRGIQKQTNINLNWESANSGINSSEIESFAISKYDIIYCGARYGSFKSTDRGLTWTDLNSPCYNDLNTGICVNSLGSVFIGGSCGVFRTTDDGNSWDLMNSNTWSNIYGITAHPSQPNVYVSDEHDFYRTTDNGTTWWRNYFSAGSALRIRINSKGYIYVLNMNGELLRSTNSGTVFQKKNNGIPSGYAKLHDIAFNSEDKIYLASEDGLYESGDYGNSWLLIDDSPLSKDINRLYFNSDNHLYAGTMRAGVLRSVNILTELNAMPGNNMTYSLSENYPNPFNPSTKIRYSVPRQEKVQIVVYDILGKEAGILVNEEKPAGQYEVEFKADKLSSGIYFYRMQAGLFISVKKMILMK